MSLGDEVKVILTQEDGGATHGASAACSGASVTGETDQDRAMGRGGTPGSSEQLCTVAGSTTEAAFFLESEAIGLTRWEAGVWFGRLNITSGNANVTLEEVHACRVNSSGVSQGSIWQLTGLGTSLASPKVIRTRIVGSEQVASATDRVYIVFVFTNSDGAPQDVGITPDQEIITPIVDRRVVRMGHHRYEREANAIELQGLVPDVVHGARTFDMPIGEVHVACDATQITVDHPTGRFGRALS